MKHDRMREMTLEMTVGAFMFSVLVALGILTIILSRENFLAKRYDLLVVFDEVRGLREGDNVIRRGVRVGRVKSLEIRDDGVYLHLSLNRPVKLKEDYRIEIAASSVLGGQDLSIYVGSRDAAPLADDVVPRGSPPVDLVKEASETFRSVRSALVDGGILDHLKSTMEQVNEITARLEQGEGTVGKLLRDETVYNDLSRIVTNLKDVSQRLNEGQGTIGKLLAKDDTVYRDLQDITTNLKKVSERLADGKGTLGKLLAEDDTLYADLADGVKSIKDIAGTISSGKGTLGKLTKEDELYEEAKLLLQEIRAAVDDLRESTPITTFSSVFFGAF